MDTPVLSTSDGQPIVLTDANDPPTQIELFPIGQIALRHRNGVKGPVVGQVTDAAALVATSMARAAGNMIPIDFDHGLDDLGTKDGRAAGWITALAVVGDKIVATVEWTVAGKDALREKLYRFISPVFYTSQTDGEVTHVARAGLTNFPALPELKQVASASDHAPQSNLQKVLAAALGLDVNATDTEIVAGLLDQQRLTPATTAAASGIVADASAIPIEAVANYIANQGKSDLVKHAATAVDNAMQAGQLPPALKAWGIDLCQSDPQKFNAFLAASPFSINGDLGISGAPASATPAHLAAAPDHRASICEQLNLPPGSLNG